MPKFFSRQEIDDRELAMTRGRPNAMLFDIESKVWWNAFRYAETQCDLRNATFRVTTTHHENRDNRSHEVRVCIDTDAPLTAAVTARETPPSDRAGVLFDLLTDMYAANASAERIIATIQSFFDAEREEAKEEVLNECASGTIIFSDTTAIDPACTCLSLIEPTSVTISVD